MEAAQRDRHFTFGKAHRDDKDSIFGEKVGFFERQFQFLMTVSMLFIETARKADNYHVTLEERIADLILPILPGLEPFRIEPDVEPVSNQTLVQLVGSLPVTVRVDEEYVRFSC